MVGEVAEGQAAPPLAKPACNTVDDTPVLTTMDGDSAGSSFSARQELVRAAEEVVARPPVLEKDAGALRVKAEGCDRGLCAVEKPMRRRLTRREMRRRKRGRERGRGEPSNVTRSVPGRPKGVALLTVTGA